MDRWRYLSGTETPPGERSQHKQAGVRLYDGDSKTNVEDVTLELTSHRLIIRDWDMVLDLSKVSLVDKEDGGFFGSDKINLRLYPLSPSELPADRPFMKQKHNSIKISFRGGGQTEFHHQLSRCLEAKAWKVEPAVSRAPARREIRAGITGIEKKINLKARQDNANISKAFEDLNKLMEMAKPMVQLAQSISTKIRDKQGEITEDETVQFKSYLLSLGVDDPITKDTAGSDKKYYQGLAREMFLILDQPIQQSGGMITLTDAFVRVNRARGLELVSPDDILMAAKSLKETSLPMRLHTFQSGVLVLMTSNHSEEEIRQDLMNQVESIVILCSSSYCLPQVESLGSLTAEELSRLQGLSVILATERLLSAETEGLLCRDYSVEGLRFYQNRFLTLE